MKKKFINLASLLLVLALCLSLTPAAFASELPTDQSSLCVGTITVADAHGNDVQYKIYDNAVTDIPIFAAKEGEENLRELTEVATLSIGISDDKAVFVFTPSTVGIALLTVGFSGDITTYHHGLKYGYNSYTLPVLTGSASASTSGTGTLSGSYSVVGYATAKIFEGFTW